MTTVSTKTPVMVLHELTVKRKIGPPKYELVFSQAGTHQNRFDHEVTVNGIKAKGTGSSKQVSKHQAATNALNILKELGEYDPSSDPFAPSFQENGYESYNLDCIAPLTNLCVDNKVPTPIFTQISDIGPPHAREFTYQCKIASIKTEAKGSTKKMAKQLAAKEMMERIKNIIPDLIVSSAEKEEFDKEAVIKFNEVREFVQDRGIPLEEYHLTLKRIMDERDISCEDLTPDLEEKTSDSLKRICQKLELNCDIICIQKEPAMVALSLHMDTPFCVIGVSKTESEATQKAFEDAFKMLDFFIKV